MVVNLLDVNIPDAPQAVLTVSPSVLHQARQLDGHQLRCYGHQSLIDPAWKTRIAGPNPHTASTALRSAAGTLASLEEKATFWVVLSWARPLLCTDGPRSTPQPVPFEAVRQNLPQAPRFCCDRQSWWPSACRSIPASLPPSSQALLPVYMSVSYGPLCWGLGLQHTKSGGT